MNFDLSKVYTSVNAGQLMSGDKVIVADNLKNLKNLVEKNEGISTIVSINDEAYSCRFIVSLYDGVSFALAYLVDKADWHTYHIGDIIRNKRNGYTGMVTGIDANESEKTHVYAFAGWIADEELNEWEVLYVQNQQSL